GPVLAAAGVAADAARLDGSGVLTAAVSMRAGRGEESSASAVASAGVGTGEATGAGAGETGTSLTEVTAAGGGLEAMATWGDGCDGELRPLSEAAFCMMEPGWLVAIVLAPGSSGVSIVTVRFAEVSICAEVIQAPASSSNTEVASRGVLGAPEPAAPLPAS